MVRFACLLALAILVLSASCAEPPSKEMNQALGAIDAARAAAADRFAAAEFAAAVDALTRSEQAAANNDYRLALSLAIDSRARAQSATKLAVETQAKGRGEAERAISEAATLVQRAQAQLEDPDLAALNPRVLGAPRLTVEAAEQVLQEARSALGRDDYPAVTRALGSVTADLHAALRKIDAAASPAPPRRKR